MNINNYVFLNKCPFCKSYRVIKIGNLEYESPLHYSLYVINLLQKPELWKCNNCNSLFTNNIIPEDISKKLYSEATGKLRWSGIAFTEDKELKVQNCIKAILANYQINKVLDVGCNTGEFLDFAKTHKLQTFGIELNHSANVICKDKGHKVYDSLENVTETFDAITCFDLVEHLYHPKLFLKRLEDKLNPKGFLIIHTGNPCCISSKLSGARWWYARYPEHISFPSIDFFNMLENLKIYKILKCYASKISKRTSRNKMRFVLDLLTKKYNGIPALSKDHNLVILRKN